MDVISYEFVLPLPEVANTPRTLSPPPVDPHVEYPAEDNDDQPASPARYSEAYPRSAGQPIRKEKTDFEKFRDDDSDAGRPPWDPFASKKEWELARWLINNVNQRATEEYLNLPIVRVLLL